MRNAVYCLLLIALLFPLNDARGASYPDCTAGDVRPNRPYVFTTDEQISRACDRINDRTEPFHTSYRATINRANVALDKPTVNVCETRIITDASRIWDDRLKPYCGRNHRTFFNHVQTQATYARDLAVAFQVTGDLRYADRAIEFLDQWTRQSRRYPHSGVDDCGPNGDQCYHATGLVLGMSAVVFGDVYALVYERMTSAERARILDMIASYEHFIHVSRGQWVDHSYYGNQLYNNHLSAHNMGLVAIGYLTGDLALKNYAINSVNNVRDFREMINGAIIQVGDRLYYRDPSNSGAPQPLDGEIYDRYRIISNPPRGNSYAAFHTRMLAVTAEVIIANGQTNYWPYVAPGGETLRWVFSPYSVLVSTGNPAAGTGYYAPDGYVSSAWMFLYELGAQQWPGDAMIQDALRSRVRLVHDGWFGYSFLLTHGRSGLPPMWAFNLSRYEGWTFRNLSGPVANGYITLNVRGSDPQMRSPNRLHLHNRWVDEVRFRMKNSTADTVAQLFFRTDQAGETNFTADKKLTVAIVPNDTGFRTYSFRVADHPKWAGYIEQLRLDAVNSATTGQVQIDWIHLYNNGQVVHR